jgi:hypothetical protein
MRFMRYISICLATAALAAAGASAHDHPGKGREHQKACRPAPVMLAGILANDPAAGDTSLQLDVKHANKLGRLYRKAGNPVSMNVDAKTRYRRNGEASTLDALAQGDRALVFAKACRADVRKAIKDGSALPALTARAVLAKAPKAESSGTQSESSGS